MKGNTFYDKASDPCQYDNTVWFEVECSLETGTRNVFYQMFDKGAWKKRTVLDIGCGTGWLVNNALETGACYAEGIDSSYKNVRRGRELYPSTKLHHTSIQEFSTDQKYDLIILLMSMNHISDVESVLIKIQTLCSETGICQLIIPDYEYFKTPRKNYQLELEERSDNEYVVKTNRKEGNVYDIIRKTEWYEDVIRNVGLRITKSMPIKPIDKIIAHLIELKR